MHIRKNDMVVVLTGNHSGSRGKVLRIDHSKGRVVVEGVNRVYKHVKRSQRNPQGGRLSKEMPIDISNVMLVCTACGSASRTGARIASDGSKERFCRSCGAGIGLIMPTREKRAAKSVK